MVMRNGLEKRDGAVADIKKQPRQFLFDIGDYNVAFRRYRNKTEFYVDVWHRKKKIGDIDLTKAYKDVKTVLSIDCRIKMDYQGLGIAYRVYEGLANEANVAIQSNNQSKGAIKLWRRFAQNGSLLLYFIDDYNSDNLFTCDIFPVHANESGELVGIDYNRVSFDPYKRSGSLLLIKKKSALTSAIQRYIPLRQTIQIVAKRFKRFDNFWA